MAGNEAGDEGKWLSRFEGALCDQRQLPLPARAKADALGRKSKAWREGTASGRANQREGVSDPWGSVFIRGFCSGHGAVIRWTLGLGGKMEWTRKVGRAVVGIPRVSARRPAVYEGDRLAAGRRFSRRLVPAESGCQ